MFEYFRLIRLSGIGLFMRLQLRMFIVFLHQQCRKNSLTVNKGQGPVSIDTLKQLNFYFYIKEDKIANKKCITIHMEDNITLGSTKIADYFNCVDNVEIDLSSNESTQSL